MQKEVKIGGYLIGSVETEREINFEIFDREGYVCRMVPGLFGFSLSPLDFAFGNTRGLPMVSGFSDFILNRDA